MEITDIRFRKLFPEGKMRAIVSITIDDAFAVHDVKVVDGDNGLFVAMPSRRTASGTYRDVVHPITKEMRAYMQDKILTGYKELLDQNETVIAESADEFAEE